jgi:hypothetical protein
VGDDDEAIPWGPHIARRGNVALQLRGFTTSSYQCDPRHHHPSLLPPKTPHHLSPSCGTTMPSSSSPR